MILLACTPTCSCLSFAPSCHNCIAAASESSCWCMVVMYEFCFKTYAHYCSATYNLQHNSPSIPVSQLQSADAECAIYKEPMKVIWCHGGGCCCCCCCCCIDPVHSLAFCYFAWSCKRRVFRQYSQGCKTSNVGFAIPQLVEQGVVTADCGSQQAAVCKHLLTSAS